MKINDRKHIFSQNSIWKWIWGSQAPTVTMLDAKPAQTFPVPLRCWPHGEAFWCCVLLGRLLSLFTPRKADSWLDIPRNWASSVNWRHKVILRINCLMSHKLIMCNVMPDISQFVIAFSRPSREMRAQDLRRGLNAWLQIDLNWVC